MNRKIIFLTLCLWLTAITFPVFAQQKSDTTYIFRFVPQKDMFYVPYSDNEAELDRLLKCVEQLKERILAGEIPIRVDGYCNSWSSITENLSMAKVRSNRVKSELILQKGLKEECFSTRNHAANGNFVTVRLTVPVKTVPVKKCAEQCGKQCMCTEQHGKKCGGQCAGQHAEQCGEQCGMQHAEQSGKQCMCAEHHGKECGGQCTGQHVEQHAEQCGEQCGVQHVEMCAGQHAEQCGKQCLCSEQHGKECGGQCAGHRVEQRVERPAERSAEQHSEMCGEQCTGQHGEKCMCAEQHGKECGEKCAGHRVEQRVERSAEPRVEHRVVQRVERSAEQHSEMCGEQCTGQHGEQCMCSEQHGKECGEMCAGQPAEQRVERPAEPRVEHRVERRVERSAEQHSEQCGEKCAEQHGEMCGEMCGEQCAERCAEQHSEMCAEMCSGQHDEMCGEMCAEMCGEMCAKRAEQRPIVVDDYNFALRFNLLRWITLTPDLGIEWRISPTVGILVNSSWTSLTWNDNYRRYALWEVMPELRLYMGARKAWYMGAMFKTGQFNYNLTDKGKQGDIIGGGLTFGYQLRLSEFLSMDLGLALGYLQAEYENYEVTNSVPECVEEGTQNWWGPINAGITLVWKLF